MIEDIEKVQKRATKLVKGLNKLSYRERLMHLKLPTLKFRRIRGVMIEIYTIVTNKYDRQVVPNIPMKSNVITRGNTLKLEM